MADPDKYPYSALTPAAAHRVATAFQRHLRLTATFGEARRGHRGYADLIVRADPTRADPTMGVIVGPDGKIGGMGLLDASKAFELDFDALDVRAEPYVHPPRDHHTTVQEKPGPFWLPVCSCGWSGKLTTKAIAYRQTMTHREEEMAVA